jgi:Tol biopolymer transport system component
MNALAVPLLAVALLASCAAPPPTRVPGSTTPTVAASPEPAGVPVESSKPDAPTAGGDLHGEVAYVGGEDPQIHLLDLATGESRQLTDLQPADAELALAGPMRPVLSCAFGPSSLAWSPDGSQLAFAYGGCDSVVYVVDLEGRMRRIGDGRAPTWSPDGERLVFGANLPYSPCGMACMQPPADGAWDLVVADVSGGGEPQPLTPDGSTFGAGQPRYSPDGTLIAYTGPLQQPEQDETLFQATYVIRSDGTDPRLIARGAWPSAWLPDGRLVIVEESSGRAHAVDVESAEAELLLDGAHFDQPSPDGSHFLAITFDAVTGANRVHLVTADGEAVGELPGYAPSWAPDGSAIVVSDVEQSAIVVVGRDGSVLVTHPVRMIGGDYRARWRPGS